MKKMLTATLIVGGMLALTTAIAAGPPRGRFGFQRFSSNNTQRGPFTTKKFTTRNDFKANKFKIKKATPGPFLNKKVLPEPIGKKIGGVKTLKSLGFGKAKWLGSVGKTSFSHSKKWYSPTACYPVGPIGSVYVKYQMPIQQIYYFQNLYSATIYASQLQSLGFQVKVYQTSPLQTCVSYTMPYWQYVQCHSWAEASSLASYIKSLGGYVLVTY